MDIVTAFLHPNIDQIDVYFPGIWAIFPNLASPTKPEPNSIAQEGSVQPKATTTTLESRNRLIMKPLGLKAGGPALNTGRLPVSR